MSCKQFEVWIVDLSPRFGTEPGKTRPVVVIQTDLLNKAGHPSTIICPITSKVHPEAGILRIYLKKGEAGLKKDSDIMVDQVRAIDNRRLVKKLGRLPAQVCEKLRDNLKIVMDL